MLRARLIMGMLCLLLILLAIGLYSIDRCSELGHRIVRLSDANGRVEHNLGQLKRSCAAMTGALLSLVTVDQSESEKAYDKASASFEEALNEEKARKNVSDKEKDLIAQLSKVYTAYEKRARDFLKAPLSPDDAWRPVAARLGQDTAALLDLADLLALAHEQNVARGNGDVSKDINETVRSLILLMIVAVVLTIFASYRLSSGLLAPLRLLMKSIQQVGEGNLNQTVPVLDKSELGQLAISFNQMAAQLRQYQANTSVELLRLNQTIRSTLASFPDPIFVLNAQDVVEFRNPEADQLAVKLLFSGVTRLPLEVDEKVEQVRLSGIDYLPTLFKDAIKFHLDGQDRYFLPRIVLLRDDKREVFGVAVILEDVTRMLLLDDVKSNLIATVSHELKTPLTSVRMVLYLLHEKTVGPLSERQADLVATAREDADRLLKTLNDLLDLAKLEQGPSQLTLDRVAPSELVQSAVHSTQEIAAAEGMILQAEVAPDLPAVQIDRQRIAYVFSNLIINAIKYSPKGREITIRAALGMTRTDRPAVRFSIKDQGPGIASEHQEHIFERFYRIPGSNKTGAGLGLSIAREIVIAHQGDIGVLSVPEEGSEFFFLLPLVDDDEKRLV